MYGDLLAFYKIKLLRHKSSGAHVTREPMKELDPTGVILINGSFSYKIVSILNMSFKFLFQKLSVVITPNIVTALLIRKIHLL